MGLALRDADACACRARRDRQNNSAIDGQEDAGPRLDAALGLVVKLAAEGTVSPGGVEVEVFSLGVLAAVFCRSFEVAKESGQPAVVFRKPRVEQWSAVASTCMAKRTSTRSIAGSRARRGLSPARRRAALGRRRRAHLRVRRRNPTPPDSGGRQRYQPQATPLPRTKAHMRPDINCSRSSTWP